MKQLMASTSQNCSLYFCGKNGGIEFHDSIDNRGEIIDHVRLGSQHEGRSTGCKSRSCILEHIVFMLLSAYINLPVSLHRFKDGVNFRTIEEGF